MSVEDVKGMLNKEPIRLWLSLCGLPLCVDKGKPCQKRREKPAFVPRTHSEHCRAAAEQPRYHLLMTT